MYTEVTYEVSSRDLDCGSCCRPSAILGYLQEAAAVASSELGVANEEVVAKYRRIWMVAKIGYTLEKPIRWRDTLTIRTWHRGGDKTVIYRDSDLILNGEKVGEGLGAWVLADLDSRALARFGTMPEFVGTDGGDLNRTTRLPHLRLPTQMVFAQRRELHYSDLDGNRHVNNTRYADFLCDALHLEGSAGAFPKELQIDYLKECRAGETLDLLTGQSDTHLCVRGLGPDGTPRFQGFLRL